MPRGDGTGPEGSGAMTGHGAGTCKGSEVSGSRRAAPGRGLGRGGSARGGGRRGRGGRNRSRSSRVGAWMPSSWTEAAPGENEDPETEKGILRSQLDGIRRRLSELGMEESAE